MPRIGATGAVSVDAMGVPGGKGNSLFNLSDPSGWTMLFWMLSVAIILLMFFSL